MTGTYSHTEIRDIARRFAEPLTDKELHDISQAIMNTCYAAASAGYCTPHWMDLNSIGIELGLLSLERGNNTQTYANIRTSHYPDQPGADVPAGRPDGVGE